MGQQLGHWLVPLLGYQWEQLWGQWWGRQWWEHYLDDHWPLLDSLWLDSQWLGTLLGTLWGGLLDIL